MLPRKLLAAQPLTAPSLPFPSPSPRLSVAAGRPRRTRSPRAALGRTPGLRAAVERPLALRREPRRNQRGRRRESSARAGGGGSREPSQETGRQKLVALRHSPPSPRMGPGAARPLSGPPARD